MAPKQDVEAYKAKIAELRTQLDAEIKAFSDAKERKEGELREVVKLREEKAALQGQIGELKHEIENLEQTAAHKKAVELAAITALSDTASKLKLQIGTAEFSVSQLDARIKERTKKLKEMDGIEARHAEASARLITAQSIASQVERQNASAAQERERLLNEAREIYELAHIREGKVLAEEDEIRVKQAKTEFFRNRICAYCSEKGLPIPNFEDGNG